MDILPEPEWEGLLEKLKQQKKFLDYFDIKKLSEFLLNQNDVRFFYNNKPSDQFGGGRLQERDNNRPES